MPGRRQTAQRGYLRGGPGEEADFLGCGHCSAQVEITKPGAVSVPVDFCRCCMRFICTQCETKRLKSGCKVWEEMIKDMEKEGQAKALLLEALEST